MNCLLIRELSITCVLRLFDTYHAESDDFSELHLYVCAAFLANWSSNLLALHDFHVSFFSCIYDAGFDFYPSFVY